MRFAWDLRLFELQNVRDLRQPFFVFLVNLILELYIAVAEQSVAIWSAITYLVRSFGCESFLIIDC